MNVRLAQQKDLTLIMQLITGVLPLMHASGNFQWDAHYPSVAVFENDISKDQLWVVENDGDIAGIAAITTDSDPEYAALDRDLNEPAIVTHRLAVNVNHQGRGIAALLLNKAEEVATEKKIRVLRIDTNVVNMATNKLFPKLGYRFVGEIALDFRPGMRFNCYEKWLLPQS